MFDTRLSLTHMAVINEVMIGPTCFQRNSEKEKKLRMAVGEVSRMVTSTDYWDFKDLLLSKIVSTTCTSIKWRFTKREYFEIHLFTIHWSYNLCLVEFEKHLLLYN